MADAIEYDRIEIDRGLEGIRFLFRATVNGELYARAIAIPNPPKVDFRLLLNAALDAVSAKDAEVCNG